MSKNNIENWLFVICMIPSMLVYLISLILQAFAVIPVALYYKIFFKQNFTEAWRESMEHIFK